MSLYGFARTFISPQSFQDDEKNRIAGIVNLCAAAILVGFCPLVVVRGALSDYDLIPPLLAMSIICFVSMLLVRRDRVALSAQLLSVGLLGFLNYLIVSADGIQDTAVFALPGFFVLTSMVLKRKNFLALAIVSVIAIGVIGYLEIRGVIRNAYSGMTREVDVLDLVVILSITAFTVRLLSENLVRSLASARRNERELRDSENKYRSLFEGNKDGISIFYIREDKSISPIVIANTAAAEMLGYTLEEFLGKEPSELEVNVTEEHIRKRQEALQANGFFSFETELRHKGGRSISVEIDTRVVDYSGKPALMNIVRDITERKRAEAALREDESRFRAFVEQAPLAIGVYNLAGIGLYANAKFLELLGLSSLAEMVGRPAYEFFAPQFRDQSKERTQRRLKGLLVPNEYESVCLRSGSIEFPVHLAVAPIQLAGEVVSIAFMTDITERKKSEERIRHLASFPEFNPEPVIEVDGSGKPVFCNPAAQAFLKHVGSEDARILLPQAMDEILRILGPENRGPIQRELLLHSYVFQQNIWFAPSFDTIRIYCRDVTERKRAEEALQASNERFRAISESALVGIYILLDGTFAYVNPAMARIFGYSVDEMIGMNPQVIVHPSDHAMVNENIRKRISGEVRTIQYEVKGRYRDGSPRDIEVFGSRIDINGKPAVVGTLIDITERKQAEDALRESEERYKQLFDAIPESVLMIGTDRRVVTANLASAILYGYESPQQLEGLDTRLLIAEKDRERAARVQSDVLQGEERPARHYIEVRRDGSEFFAEVTSKTLRGSQQEVLGYIGITRDISDRKRNEEALRESEQKFKMTFMTTLDAIYVATFDEGRMIEVNDAFEGIFGYTKAETIGKTIPELNLYAEPSDRAKIITLLKAEGRLRDVEINGRKKNGEVIVVSLSASILPIGNQSHIVGVIRDITERKRAEEALKTSEDKFSKIFHSNPSGIALVRARDGMVIDANETMAAIMGYDRGELVGSTVFQKGIWADPNERERLLVELTKTGTLKNVEVNFYAKDKRLVTLSASWETIAIGGERCTLGAFEDITQRKRAEQENEALQRQLVQSQKMESVGLLAGGIAHDINNILNIITGNVEFLKQRGADPAKFDKRIATIDDAVERGAALVRQLLTFARKTETMMKPVQVNAVVEDIQRFLLETFPRTIGISTHLRPHLPRIFADPTNIHQVILNLCINARDAMPDGGTLDISTELVSDRSSTAARRLNQDLEYVKIQVVDTGIGMDEITMEKAFEPFFTTKDVGKGTGLGLAILYGIVQRHNGHVEVSSRPGAGTTFSVYLPVSEESDTHAEPLGRASEDLAGGTETILLIEDEKQLRDAMEEFLSAKGYTVLTAADGEDGVSVFRKCQGTIDVVVTDLGLPKLNGEEVVKHIRSLEPSAKLILASGFLEPEKRARLVEIGVGSFVQKPYRQQELLRKIHQAVTAKQ